MSRWSRLSRHLPLRPERRGGVPVLGVETLDPGAGPAVLPGQTVRVSVDAALDGGRRLSLPDLTGEQTLVLGEGRVIRGLEHGLAGLRVGGHRRLTVPPALAFGAQGVPGSVPPGATLIVELRLLAVAPTPPPRVG